MSNETLNQPADIKELIAGFNLRLPIDSEEIPDFEQWVNFNGFSPNHKAYDFAAYLTLGGVMLGLPPTTKVRAPADGVVYEVFRFGDPYENIVWIKHEEGYGGLTSGYVHVVPSVEEGTRVRRGDIIAALYKREGNDIGNLVHLHFELRNRFQTESVDPRVIDDSLYAFNMIPPTSPKFDIPELPGGIPFEVAHFRRVDIGAEDNGLFRSRRKIR